MLWAAGQSVDYETRERQHHDQNEAQGGGQDYLTKGREDHAEGQKGEQLDQRTGQIVFASTSCHLLVCTRLGQPE